MFLLCLFAARQEIKIGLNKLAWLPRWPSAAYCFVVLPPGDEHVQLLLENSQLLAIGREDKITEESRIN